MKMDDPIGRFLRQAQTRPDHPAVELDRVVTTYGELAAMARRFAHGFSRTPQPRILIALPQGPDAYAAMAGALLAGGFYSPVNVTAPFRKIASVAELVRPDIIVAAPALAADLAAICPNATTICEAPRNGPMLAGPGQRHETAYVIFTSGSTGTPKGVVISTAALAHYVDWIAATAMMGEHDRVSQFPSISFDLSVLDIFGALNCGSTLVTPSGEGDRLFPADFAERGRISVWVSVPSVFGLAMSAKQATPDLLGGVRRYAYCGEPLLKSHLEAMFAASPGCEVLNLYGPTEATVSMTAVALHADDYAEACDTSVAFGDAIPGMGLHLVGGDSPDEGEIVITGPQLATGYWEDPARTAQAFRPVVIDGETLRGYHTGDWGERRGRHVYFCYRIDHQVKINGYRIETGEVIARLSSCGWPVACVMKHRGALTAVVETAGAGAFDAAALRARLFDELDVYAVPGVIHPIGRMPRNINHKIDEAAVRAWLDEVAGPPPG